MGAEQPKEWTDEPACSSVTSLMAELQCISHTPFLAVFPGFSSWEVLIKNLEGRRKQGSLLLPGPLVVPLAVMVEATTAKQVHPRSTPIIHHT
jgi:hypothetical protein